MHLGKKRFREKEKGLGWVGESAALSAPCLPVAAPVPDLGKQKQKQKQLVDSKYLVSFQCSHTYNMPKNFNFLSIISYVTCYSLCSYGDGWIRRVGLAEVSFCSFSPSSICYDKQLFLFFFSLR